MKKAKIVLSAVALFAVVGGAFAFKASRVPNTFFKTGTTTTLVGGVTVTRTYCTAPFQTNYTTIPTIAGQVPVAITSFYTTSTLLSACPTTRLYTLPLE